MTLFQTKKISFATRQRIAKHIDLLGVSEEDMKIPRRKAPVYRAEGYLRNYGNRAIPQLVDACHSPIPETRYRAVWLLGCIGKELQGKGAQYPSETGLPQTIRVEIERLTTDPDARVRYDAVMALGKLGDPAAVPLLETIATQDDPIASLDSAARSALMALGVLSLEEIEAG